MEIRICSMAIVPEQQQPRYGQKGDAMGFTKRLYEEMLDQEAEKAFEDNQARQLVDADGYHMVNCLCDDCLRAEDALDRDNRREGA